LYIFKNLDSSKVALNFDLIEMGVHFDYPMPWQLNFQSPATPLMEGITDLHHGIMGILIIIFVSVMYTLSYFIYHFNEKRNYLLYNITHNTK